jgi:mono/diheme cytochrome c family protein
MKILDARGKRATSVVLIALLSLCDALPLHAAKLVDAPPPPPMLEGPDEEVAKPQKPALIEKPSRGQQLYENHCIGCHESVAYIRARRHIKSLPQLREEVGRWASYTNLPWGREEIDDVVEYLNSRHYRF